ncbi:hypothetical protein Lepto7376_0692 [[Leptolyngbya] sp. PCC 7376]|uniref:hypothetical protein n=1 Tax=[Leptolyngbya] sp. PCC 7376 TaxID=111781 RepID=UPI00029ED450|nr:hypothetical protein [[Leptolyngbya] sp. PCC 7376]AFY37092.1 hypothetical protein Lepto7376_0692 [[Leptolyngbya] sp. PCC 7376]
MSLLEELPLDTLVLGELIRIPCECIEPRTKQKFNQTILRNLTKKLEASGKNISPVIIKQVGGDEYTAIQNALVLEAAKKANFDFVFCIAINDKMEAQLLLETGELLQISLIESSEKEIIEVLNFAKEKEPKLKRLKTEKVAQTIVEARNPSWNNLKTLSKLKCGVGAKTVPILSKYFVFPD